MAFPDVPGNQEVIETHNLETGLLPWILFFRKRGVESPPYPSVSITLALVKDRPNVRKQLLSFSFFLYGDLSAGMGHKFRDRKQKFT